jgi:mannosyltransferase
LAEEGAIKEDSRRHLYVVAALFCVGVVLRVVAVGREPLWGDEALTLLISQWPARDLLLSPIDPTPGLYYVLHKALIGPHAGVVAARSISVVCGSLIPLATYALGKSAGGRNVGLASMALTVLSFPLIDYSQEARAYSLLVLAVTLSAASFLWWARTNRTPALYCFAATLLLCVYVHFVAIFWVVPISIGALAMRRSRELILALGVVFLASMPEVVRLLMFPKDAFSWLSQPTASDAIAEIGRALFPFAPIWPVAAALLCLLLFFGARQRWSPEVAITLGVLLSAPVLMWLFGFAVKPIFMPRTLLIAIPAFAVALSISFKGRPWTMGAIVAAYALNLFFTGTVRQKTDWASAEAMLSSARPGDIVVLCPAWEAAAFRHAVHSTVPAPLLLEWENGFMMVEPGLGSNRDWVHSYFVNLSAAPDIRRRAFEAGGKALVAAKRVWRVEHRTECAKRRFVP